MALLALRPRNTLTRTAMHDTKQPTPHLRAHVDALEVGQVRDLAEGRAGVLLCSNDN